jgi:hypothetical protein
MADWILFVEEAGIDSCYANPSNILTACSIADRLTKVKQGRSPIFSVRSKPCFPNGRISGTPPPDDSRSPHRRIALLSYDLVSSNR